MGIRKYKPTTPGRRGASVADFVEITRSEPEKSLVRPLTKLGKTFDELTKSVEKLTDETIPALTNAVETVARTNTQLERIDTITTAAARTAEDLSATTTLVTSTVSAPFLAVRNAVGKLRGNR